MRKLVQLAWSKLFKDAMNPAVSTCLSGLASMVALCCLHTARAEEAGLSTNQAKDPARMNCGAQIECVTPDGHAGQVARLAAHDPAAIALIMEDDTITCLLQEGETNFVIELPEKRVPDRFTFVNENAAHGELTIAVSNQRLPANSPEWTQVEGIVPFVHKRLFGVSLLGVEAKFVRLSFHVGKDQMASAGRHNKSEFPSRFQTSDFDDALNSKFAALHSRASTLLLTANSLSVAPLPQISRD
jgi:hypothetical protein